MKNYQRRDEGKKKMTETDDFFLDDAQFKKRKKERREKYKVKNQKVHQMDFKPDDEFDDIELN